MRFATSTRRRGFTLVELLVVIGIIAVLIAVLIPTLSRARESARTVACASNLKQIGIGFMMYAGENKGWIPPPVGAWWAAGYKVVTPNQTTGPFWSFAGGTYNSCYTWPFYLAKYMGFKGYNPGSFNGGVSGTGVDPKFRSVFRCSVWGENGEEVGYTPSASYNDPLIVVQQYTANGMIISGGYGMNPFVPGKTPFRYNGNGDLISAGETIPSNEVWKYLVNGCGKLGKGNGMTRAVLVADGSGDFGVLGYDGGGTDVIAHNPFPPNSEVTQHFRTDYLRHNGARRSDLKWKGAASKLAPNRGGLNALYCDFHVQFTDSATALKLLGSPHPDGGNRFLNQN